MQTKTRLKELVQAFPVDGVAGDIPWLQPVRKEAFERFREIGLPTRKSESWKYINLRPLLDQTAVHPRASGMPAADPGCGLWEECVNRIVVLNGVYRPDLSRLEGESSRMTVESLAAAGGGGIRRRTAEAVNTETNPFALINAVFFYEGLCIRIPDETAFSQPVHVIFHSRGEQENPFFVNPRLFVEAGSGSSAELICHYSFEGNSVFTNAVTDVRVGRHARFAWVQIQKPSAGNTLFHALRTSVQAGGSFESLSYSHGGAMIRNEILAELEGEEARCTLNGLGVGSGETRIFDELTVNHCVPRCTSRQFYKNILAENSQTEFNSLAYVFRAAQLSDSNQLNKNLILSDTARAYSRPRLMIYADDVTASHGSASGQTEKQEMFYLQSRGLPAEQARFILTFGFAEEILQGISSEALRRTIEDEVRGELARLMGQ